MALTIFEPMTSIKALNTVAYHFTQILTISLSFHLKFEVSHWKYDVSQKQRVFAYMWVSRYLCHTHVYMCIYESMYTWIFVCMYIVYICVLVQCVKFHVLCCDNVLQHIMSFYIHIFLTHWLLVLFLHLGVCWATLIRRKAIAKEYTSFMFVCLQQHSECILDSHLSSTSSQINVWCDRFLFMLIWRSHVTSCNIYSVVNYSFYSILWITWAHLWICINL